MVALLRWHRLITGTPKGHTPGAGGAQPPGAVASVVHTPVPPSPLASAQMRPAREALSPLSRQLQSGHPQCAGKQPLYLPQVPPRPPLSQGNSPQSVGPAGLQPGRGRGVLLDLAPCLFSQLYYFQVEMVGY